MSDYRPGDLVNGHVLGEDNQWHRLSPAVQPVTRRTYGERYYGRWKWTCLVFGLLTVIAGVSEKTWPTNAGLMVNLFDLVLRLVVGGATFGSVVNLGVAAIPGTKPLPAA